ncbi:MAG TPA: serine/threonine-protein kinase [Polyangia bacterium]|nr:serine/threonine-protein kinase [Polyangia bacterium]
MSVQLSEPIQFGKYTLFERIGRGGMADVYKGRVTGPQGFERTFVVKRILPHLSDDATFIKMFVEEAKLSARLAHPNIVQIFELGAVEGEYFISMEYIRGRDLSETMRAIWKTMGPPRPELVAYIGREACRALSYAHSLADERGRPLGMIHRDVSPSNIMMSYEGAVKLLDFGIAKALGEAPETTKSGTMKGKYAYMAPEQTEGDDVDHRIDIFSCGIVLHEVLTGRRLFKGQNDVLTIERVRRCEVPPPSLQNPLVPPELDAIVLRALARDRDDRWATAADMADALDDVVHAARFQPTHLAQLLHDLFPVDGGAPSPRLSVNASAHVTSSSIRAGRSATIPPVTRTGSGTGTATGTGSVRRRSLPASESSMDVSDVSLKPRSKWKGAVATALVLAAGGFFVWKGGLKKKLEDDGGARLTAVSDPSKRFHVYVKSEPPGADIFVEGEAMPIGETPVTLPIDLTGKSSLKLVLRKDGYEDYDQRVINEMPLSINLKKRDATPDGGESGEGAKPSSEGAEGAGVAPAATPAEGPVVAPPGTTAKGTHRHHHAHKSAPPPPTEVDQ